MRKELKTSLNKNAVTVSKEDLTNEKDLQYLADLVDLDRKQFNNDMGYVYTACRRIVEQRTEELRDIRKEILTVENQQRALKESLNRLKDEELKLDHDKLEAVRISLKWVSLEKTIIPAQDLCIATKLDKMKNIIMTDLAGSDRKVKA